MRVLLSGSSGLIGSALRPVLERDGHEVIRLVRRQGSRSGEIAWNPAANAIDAEALDGFDAVVHLAGEPIVRLRWTKRRKQAIKASRVEGTRLLCEALAGCVQPPRIFVGASAIGYYGAHRGADWLTEESSPGRDFLAETCQAWERASMPLESGTRVVKLRIGPVLSRFGGALKHMLRVFRLGLGGRLGRGDQYFSWIMLDDVVAAIGHGLGCDDLRGPVNTTSPAPVTNAEFTRVLGEVLGRPTLLPVPAPMIRLLLGEMGDSLMLSSSRVRPRALERSGFKFRTPDLRSALERCLA